MLIKHGGFSHIDFHIFIDEVNHTLFNWDITEIIEVTYAYKKIGPELYYNTTLFSSFWGFPYKKHTNFDIVLHTVEQKLYLKISQINYFLEQALFVWTNTKEDKIRLKFLKKQLSYVKNAMEIALHWIVFELEKAWYNWALSKDEIKSRVKKIRILEKENFWWKIKANPQEVVLCYEALKRKQRHINPTKKIELEYFLEKIEKILPEWYTYEKKNSARKKRFPAIFHTLITRDDYCKIFDAIFQIYHLPQRTLISNVWSIYDGEKFLEIPNRKSYESKKLLSVLKLSLHEVMAHTINLENTKRRLWNFRGAHNLEKEEGLAILLEKLFEWNSLDHIEVIWSFPALLIGEISSARDFRKFVHLMYADPMKSLLRFKRNYPKNYPWVQHKDTSYSRWVLKTRNFIQKWWNIHDLFLWKVSYDELNYLKKISLLEENKKAIKPLFIAELLYFIINNSNKNHLVCLNDFIEYMSTKYPFLDNKWMITEYNKPSVRKWVHNILTILQKYIPHIQTEYK